MLDDGQVNFKKSLKDAEPCQYFLVENNVNGIDLSVKFEYCYKKNTVRVMKFTVNNEEEVCNY